MKPTEVDSMNRLRVQAEGKAVQWRDAAYAFELRAMRVEYVIRLLVAAGHVTQEKVDEAFNIARDFKRADGVPEARGAYSQGELAELAALPDAAIAAAFRDVAARNYSTASASLFRAHVIAKALTVGVPGTVTTPTRDGCEFCLGAKGGVPGNENRIGGHVVCDYCTPLLMDAIHKGVTVESAAGVALPRQSEPLPGVETLANVIECLRMEGFYRDDEGEATGRLEDLLTAAHGVSGRDGQTFPGQTPMDRKP